jgi:hypothetical protein
MTALKKDNIKHKFTEDLVKKILYVVEERPPALTEWEKDVINDRFKAFQTYGMGAVITKSQVKTIDFIYLKVKASKLCHL